MFFKSPKEIQEEYKMPNQASTETPLDINDVYTIGNNINGDTIIHLKSGMSSMVLTLSPPAVNRMIRLLKATLESYEIEDEELNTQENNDNK